MHRDLREGKQMLCPSILNMHHLIDPFYDPLQVWQWLESIDRTCLLLQAAYQL